MTLRTTPRRARPGTHADGVVVVHRHPVSPASSASSSPAPERARDGHDQRDLT